MNDALIAALKKKMMGMPSRGGMEEIADERLEVNDDNRGLMDQAPEIGGQLSEGAEEASDNLPSPEELEILMAIADRSAGGRAPGSLGERAAQSARVKMDELKKKK